MWEVNQREMLKQAHIHHQVPTEIVLDNRHQDTRGISCYYPILAQKKHVQFILLDIYELNLAIDWHFPGARDE